MPLLILLGMLLVYAIIAAVEGWNKQTRPFTKTELDEISRLIRGKSQKEARRIIRQYGKMPNETQQGHEEERKCSEIPPNNTFYNINGNKTMVDLRNEKYDQPVVSTSPFQDSLMSAARTTEEVTEEKSVFRYNKIKKDAEESIENIHRKILYAAKQGQYTEQNGKCIVSVLCYIPFDYCKQTKITSQKTILEASSDFEVFFSMLRERAEREGITVSPVIVEHAMFDFDDIKAVYSFPATFTNRFDFLNVTLRAKCECCIPEKYSTDIPIEFDMPQAEVACTETMKVKEGKESISIDNMEGHQFEEFCASILSRNGYTDVEVTRGSGDQGIDVIAFKDGVKFGIQCKCYSSDVGNKAVQEAFSGKTYYKCHVGAVLTNRYFTRSAIELAKSNGVLLWDRGYLLNLIKRAGIKIDS